MTDHLAQAERILAEHDVQPTPWRRELALVHAALEALTQLRRLADVFEASTAGQPRLASFPIPELQPASSEQAENYWGLRRVLDATQLEAALFAVIHACTCPAVLPSTGKAAPAAEQYLRNLINTLQGLP